LCESAYRQRQRYLFFTFRRFEPADANRHTIETFLRYSFEQGLTQKHSNIEDLFPKETLDAFRV
jgi:hypothetical protein